MQCLPAQGSDRFPWGTRWNCWNPTSEETPAPAALCVASPLDGAPACWGCTVSLQSLIYRYIFPSYHTAVTRSPGDCSHTAHRIASLSPTMYWALKPNRRKNKETKQNWAYGIIIQEVEAGIFWNFLLKASMTSENYLLVVNKMYLHDMSQNWEAVSWRNLSPGQGHHGTQTLKTTFKWMGYFILAIPNIPKTILKFFTKLNVYSLKLTFKWQNLKCGGYLVGSKRSCTFTHPPQGKLFYSSRTRIKYTLAVE